MNKEYDYLFKIVIIGKSNVGKSSLLLRFADDTFNESYLATIGVDFRFKTISIDEKKWDTAGQERFRTITNAYYKGADGIILVYDTTDEIDTYWFNEVESYAEKNVSLLLLGNKCDMTEEKVISTEKAQEYATKKTMDFYETSAKTSEQVEKAFFDLSKKLVNKKSDQIAEKKAQTNAKRQEKQKRIFGETKNETPDYNSLSLNEKSAAPGTNKNNCDC